MFHHVPGGRLDRFPALRHLVRPLLTLATAVALTLPVALTPAPADAAPTGDITTFVVTPDGAGVASVAVGLFQAAGSDRAAWVRDTTTEASVGAAYFEGLEPGCYILTFTAPAGRFFANGGQYLNSAPACLADGDSVNVAPAVLVDEAGTGTVNGTVVTAAGPLDQPVAVGIFRFNGDGSRGDWLRDITTANGAFTTRLAPECYVLTYTAPAGIRFSNGAEYLNSSFCVSAGETVTLAPAVLVGGVPTGTINGTVRTAAGSTPQEASIGVFQVNGDGTRGAWLRDVTTTNGAYTVSLFPGCYILTFVAPEQYSFDTGFPYLNSPATCVAEGQTVNGGDPLLLPDSQFVFVNGGASTPGFSAPVEGLAVGVFQANGDGTRGAWVRDVRTVEDGGFVSGGLPAGCYVLTFTAPAGMTFNLGRAYFTTGVICPAPGQTEEVFVTVAPTAEAQVISGTVRTAGGRPVPGVAVGLFETNSDNSRGRWLVDTATGAGGTYTFDNLLDRLCYVVTFTAPAGRQFSNGGQYQETLVCRPPLDGQFIPIDATLAN